MRQIGCSIAACHIAGVSNGVADSLSRLAETMYGQRRITKSGRRWIAAALNKQGFKSFVCVDVGVGTGDPQGAQLFEKVGAGGVVCSIPPPSAFVSGGCGAWLSF